jgi:hypothetical protein
MSNMPAHTPPPAGLGTTLLFMWFAGAVPVAITLFQMDFHGLDFVWRVLAWPVAFPFSVTKYSNDLRDGTRRIQDTRLDVERTWQSPLPHVMRRAAEDQDDHKHEHGHDHDQ